LEALENSDTMVSPNVAWYIMVRITVLYENWPKHWLLIQQVIWLIRAHMLA